jgi:aspartyl-tRNA(Asn)/glutamyl-tRNA(Gln) amidotransferase subunit A
VSGTDLTTYSLSQIADLIRRREVSPVAVTDAVLARIEQLEPRLNAFITVLADDARATARRAEAEIAAGP